MKGVRGMSGVTCRFLPFVLSTLLIAFLVVPVTGDVAYIIKRPSGDRGVSIIFHYDSEAEDEILAALKVEGHILLWQILCVDKYVFYRPFEFNQGRIGVRPVLCLVKKFSCQTGGDENRFVYQGYLFLDKNFDLESPINVTLADKTIRAMFIQ
jgi:hypothetical protein